MPELLRLRFTVNGTAHELQVPPLRRLLDVLREDLGLTGSKEGCGEGECGACAVRMDGLLANACLVPALHAQGSDITTIEGLAQNGRLHPLQDAFLRCGGAQCGICTPGMVLAATDLLARCPQPDEATIRQGLSGNLCRCTGYVKIVDAVAEAAKAGRP